VREAHRDLVRRTAAGRNAGVAAGGGGRDLRGEAALASAPRRYARGMHARPAG